MSKVYGEPANVQARDDGRPARFVWRGRLYTVRAIHEHWVINREWWQEPRAEPGQAEPGHPEPGHPEPGHPEPGHPEPGHPEPGRAGPGQAQPELEFWRVEASPGPGLTAEVYDLRRDAAGAWTLRSQAGR